MSEIYLPLTAEQERLHELYRRSSEVRDFLDTFYSDWRHAPAVAFEALAELQEMGGVP